MTYKISPIYYSNYLVLGNYFSLRSDHTKAAAYFQRAVKLNPKFMSALILRGHEFMEMKNSRSAIACYRDAIGNNCFKTNNLNITMSKCLTNTFSFCFILKTKFVKKKKHI